MPRADSICACGCGAIVKYGPYARGHHERAPEARAARSDRWKGPGNPGWTGDEVSYVQLHKWVADNKAKTGRCDHCGEERYTERANVSGEYKRDLDDFIELCVPCHKKYDGR